MKKIIFFIVFSCFTLFSYAQNNTQQNQRLKIFIDCSNTWCDMSFIRTEINIVDFYLDRLAADLHILITEQRTGSGGSQYQMIFFGQNRFKNQEDTMQFSTDPNLTEFESRDMFIKYLKLGLAPYLAKTGLVNSINIDFKKPENNENVQQEKKIIDPWKYWVFRMGVSGYFEGESSVKSSQMNGSISARKTTEKIKIEFRTYGGKNKTKSEYTDSLDITRLDVVNKNNYGAEHSIVFSLNKKWSYGYELGYYNSTFSNNKGSGYLRTAIEYNFYSYSEVNSKYLAISYGLSVHRNNYFDSTIYDKLNEVLYGHYANLQMSYTKKWGNLYGAVEYRNYFHDWKLKNFEIKMGANVRITGGLSFNVHSSYSIIRDQVFLLKEKASDLDILTRRRLLQTGFQYYMGFGINYRFGSKLNNFINPRFEGPN